MEAVAAAASIAGIITLVFQSIDGLFKFKELFSDTSAASKTVSRLLNDINSLIQVLENVKDVLEQFHMQKKDKNFASLDVKLMDCSKDVQFWLATARILRPSSEQGGRAWLKKFRLAANKDAIRTIRDDIGRHRQIICLSLAVLGRYWACISQLRSSETDFLCRTIDLDTSEQVHQIGSQVNQAVSTSASNQDAQELILRRIEDYSRASLHSSTQSIRSMDTIRNELARLESMITSSKAGGAPNTEKHQSSVTLKYANERSAQVRLPSQEASSSSSKGPLDVYDLPSPHSDTVPVSYGESGGHRHPKANIYPIVGANSIENWSATSSKQSRYESRFLYASVSDLPAGPTPKRPPETKRVAIDYSATHNLLQRSMADIYPSVVAHFISIHHLLTLCESHLILLQEHPSVHPDLASSTERQGESSKLSFPIRLRLQNQVAQLHHAIQASRQQCMQAGYSLWEIDRVILSTGSSRGGAFSPRHLPTGSDGEDWKDAFERPDSAAITHGASE